MLKTINNAYSKFIITLDDEISGNFDGIKVIGISEFLNGNLKI